MIRRRRGRASPVAADGDLVIDGRIRARLLGLPLLDLDAHVVVGPARTHRPASAPAAPLATSQPSGRPAVRPSAGSAVVGTDSVAPNGSHPSALGRAVRLLGEGSTALDDARRIRRRALAAPGASSSSVADS